MKGLAMHYSTKSKQHHFLAPLLIGLLLFLPACGNQTQTSSLPSSTSKKPLANPGVDPIAAEEDRIMETLGKEWKLAASGDFNEDGLHEVVAYKPFTTNTTLSDSTYPFIITEVQVMQEKDDQTISLVSVSPEEIKIPGKTLVDFTQTTSAPMAFKLRVDEKQEPRLDLLPLDSKEQPYPQALGIYWNSEQKVYQLLGPGQKLP